MWIIMLTVDFNHKMKKKMLIVIYENFYRYQTLVWLLREIGRARGRKPSTTAFFFLFFRLGPVKL